MKKLPILFSVACAWCSSLCWAGTFEKIDFTQDEIKKYNIGSRVFYSFTGKVEESDLNVFEKLAEKYKSKLSITLNSSGGEFTTGLLLGMTTRELGVHIIVDEALSSAGFWALGDKKREFIDDDSVLGIHLPYTNTADPKPELWMQLGCFTRDYLAIMLDEKSAKDLMDEMTTLRIKKGKNVLVVYTKKGKSVMEIKE